MKKTLVLILLITLCLLTGCTDYSEYKEVKIPDDNMGTVKIPKHWQFEVVDDWIHIIDTTKEKVIGIQYYKGDYYTIHQTVYDERLYNPYFDNYEFIVEGITSGNSNGGNYGSKEIKVNEMKHNCRYLLFNGTTNHRYDIEIIMIDDSIEDSVLSNIAKSYKR